MALPSRDAAGQAQAAWPALTGAMSKLRVKHFQLLDAIEAHGSLRQAALALSIQQAAALALIDDLEFAFGMALVTRDHSGTVLTSAAHPILARARLALQEITVARQFAARTYATGGRLRLGASPYLIAAMVPEMVALLGRDRPALELEVREGTLDALIADLTQGRLDAVLGSVEQAALLSSAVALESTVLVGEEMWVVAGKGHPLFGRRRASLDEVLAGPWVLPLSTSHVRGLVDSAVFDCGVPSIQPRVECRGIHNLLAIAATAGLLSVGPRSEIDKRVWRGRVSRLRTPLALKAPPYFFVSRRHAQPGPDLLALRSCAAGTARRLFGAGGDAG